MHGADAGRANERGLAPRDLPCTAAVTAALRQAQPARRTTRAPIPKACGALHISALKRRSRPRRPSRAGRRFCCRQGSSPPSGLVCACCSSLSSVQGELAARVSHHAHMSVAEEFGPRVTHVVALAAGQLAAARTLKYMHGVAAGRGAGGVCGR